MHNTVSILPPKRGRSSLHSFSIRDLLLVTVIVALALGWWLDRSRLAAESELRYERIYEMTLEKHGRYPRLDEMSPPWTAIMPTSQAPAPNPPKP
jgi:hypothetical protein